ncbi:uncharacterized protein LOC130976095 [Arachis stenosperma]|uniref:uncharacterized protein LOC130976095 n=1 Tax=Arachis stenosperma TaxID=217475 RepID=UPI0025ACEEC2|nr:uncharacterized protein LOC130976095 [Arachis stenosperma]
MANYGTTQRVATSSSNSSSKPENYEPKVPNENHFKIFCPFSIPLTSESAAVRIIRNFGIYGLYYTHFVWIILFITLIPARKVSLILLVIMTYVTSLFLLILRTWPNSFLLHKIINKWFVLAVIAVATAVQLVLTDAGIHLAVTLACSMPLVLVHAVLWVGFYGSEVVNYDAGSASASREGAPLFVANESGDKVSNDAV